MPLSVRYLPRYAARGIDPVAAFVADGAAPGFIRPSRRTRIIAPRLSDDRLTPPPPDLVLIRTPRSAGRTCDRQEEAAACTTIYLVPVG